MKLKYLAFLTLMLSMISSCQNDGPSNALDQHMADYAPPEQKWRVHFIPDSGQSLTCDEVGKFTEGLAPININGLWGYIDTTLNLTIRPQYLSAQNFKNGLAVVRAQSGYFIIIDKKGKALTSSEYQEIKSIQGKYFKVSFEETSQWLDQNGKLVNGLSDIQYTFNDGRLIAGRDDEMFLFGDKTVPLSKGYDQLLGSNADIILAKKGRKWTFLNSKGELLINEEFDAIEPYIEQWSVVQIEARYHVIDLKGNILMSHDEYILNMGQGWFALKNNKYWLVTNLEMDMPEIKVNEVHRFDNGLAVVRKGNAYNYLKVNGQFLLQEDVLLAWDFESYITRIIDHNGFRLIDEEGQPIHDDSFLDIKDLGKVNIWATIP